mmetsp:Transcript_13283/g.19539  ORF Transcript_13283/g.19539 Transcript_13283/m.19539 type:complete len:265 (-) Transcript_13283:203-997(-)|eukprot:CAMPEP_0194211446 /NCGR_PEP_ID=MMETSP0156-20130528/10271_1 /TAXON_ID=33649 /ORGANISM="Thalassionema nitzschioides, Strain L26-B" /LENGTH=264 /DNA_ID=CAMNT_0038938989 /DNA_START=56 /DNA_END=850 /DNA_ORIENTATION=+
MADDDEEIKICKIYDKEDFFTVLVQLLLAAFALGSLWIKRMRETPKRKFLTWFLDVSKQGVGACYAHVMNMVIAALISQNSRGDLVLEDQCAWYGMSFLIDVTIGLVFSIIFLGVLDRVANERNWTSLKNSGVYVGDDALLHWIHQVLAWLAIQSLVKVIVYLFMWAFSGPLAWIGGVLFSPFQNNIRIELVFVMILFPGILNVVYFWISDSYLQAKEGTAGVHEDIDESAEEKKTSLLTEEEKVEGSGSKAWTNVDERQSALA